MVLIKSISGIRGTIGGSVGKSLSPLDIVKFTAAFGTWIKNKSDKKNIKIVIGRDARISGEMVMNLSLATLQALGIDVLNLGLSTTPTVELAVAMEKADGGIVLTASHNPKEWNALKLLNNKGEFIDSSDGIEVLDIAEKNFFEFVDVDLLGKCLNNDDYINIHIDEILKLDLVDVSSIKNKKFKVVIDAVNSSGGIAIPLLLDKLGVNYIKLNCVPDGKFAHNPEPLAENLNEISKLVVSENADLGIVVDPDVDRLALINEDGSMFGEEYTLVSIADYILSKTPGNTVSNLSSSRALKDISDKYNCEYEASAVGEVNVVKTMKRNNAVIGGEGNGGIIYPNLHYGRDSLVGIALFLSHLANKNIKCSKLRSLYPNYYMSKKKIELNDKVDLDKILEKLKSKFINSNEISTIDGLKIHFQNEWIHLRKSNTEPIIRIYSESVSEKNANDLAEKFISEIKKMIV